MQLFKIKNLTRLASIKADNEEKIGPSFQKLKKKQIAWIFIVFTFLFD